MRQVDPLNREETVQQTQSIATTVLVAAMLLVPPNLAYSQKLLPQMMR